jgi:hypothetical protein
LYHSAYQRGYQQGASEALLRSQAPEQRVTHDSPIFKRTSAINTIPTLNR